MTRLTFVFPICLLLLVCSGAIAQESAKVQITVKVPAQTPSFKDQRLVIFLAHNFPLQDDRGDKTIDRHIDAKFSHDKGKETVVTVTLGEKMKRDPSVEYFVNVSIYTRASKLTHIGEINGEPGPFAVLKGGPSKLTIIVSPAP